MPSINYASVVTSVNVIYNAMVQVSNGFSEFAKAQAEAGQEQADFCAFIITSMDEMRAMLGANSAATTSVNSGMKFL